MNALVTWRDRWFHRTKLDVARQRGFTHYAGLLVNSAATHPLRHTTPFLRSRGRWVVHGVPVCVSVCRERGDWQVGWRLRDGRKRLWKRLDIHSRPCHHHHHPRITTGRWHRTAESGRRVCVGSRLRADRLPRPPPSLLEAGQPLLRVFESIGSACHLHPSYAGGAQTACGPVISPIHPP